MNLKKINPRVSLNKAFLKKPVGRNEIELFKKNLNALLNQIDPNQSEEFNKNLLSAFLRETYYRESCFINTNDRTDLVIHKGKNSSFPVAVMAEIKSPSNKSEMPTPENLNVKAFQELILYYLRERITKKNIEIKHLIISNAYEWFIFDSVLFEKEFAQNKELVRRFTEFENENHNTSFFYNEIAKEAINKIDSDIPFTYFDIRDYAKTAGNSDLKDDTSLISLYKIFSPEHLLKLPFSNDSNTLDKAFYTELLHIIGLVETKDGGKKIIGRKKPEERNPSSLMENAIAQLDSLDKLSWIDKPERFGENRDDRLFNIALELVITWINRILFLKLLEGQLIAYNREDASFAFLNSSKLKNFDDLNTLFFSVLAKKLEDRAQTVKDAFSKVPYLNSSLFEPSELEQKALFISQLTEGTIPIHSATVLKDSTGKKRTGDLPLLQYFFEFLSAYDFAGEGSEEIQEDNKTLINASVLGLIFEKINGYKDGSFFTPGFITMYMCRETIRKAVVQKFNEAKKWNCLTLTDVYNKIEDRAEANSIVNSIKICDPAVGSGHFLVSALNEIIAIKGELKILSDRKGKWLKEYHIEVANDELAVTDEDGALFEYNPKNPESRRVQETLFHEKETIIENCLFGVDINPNSVKICRLRLWIELLKNAYYTEKSNFTELETLPNIDINIKCGNSLISRYGLDADIRKALKKSKWNIDTYRLAVMSYRNAQNKDEKRSMEKLIETIKKDFESEVAFNDRRVLKLNKLRGQLFSEQNQPMLLERTKVEKAAWEKRIRALLTDIDKIEKELEQIKSNKIYENAFEWRFEFPEVLNNEGDFIGFDVVIGNPPYGCLIDNSSKDYFNENYKSTEGPYEVYKYFIERGFYLLNKDCLLCYISPDTWFSLSYFKKLRRIIADSYKLEVCSETLYDVFSEASVDTAIYILRKTKAFDCHFICLNASLNYKCVGRYNRNDNDVSFVFKQKPNLIDKIENESIPLSNVCDIWRGMSAYGASNPDKPYNSFSKDTEFHLPLLNGGDIGKYSIRWAGEYIKYGKWLHRPRPKHIYDEPHLIIQRIRNPRLLDRIIATFDDQKYIYSDGLSSILLKPPRNDVSLLKTLLAIINSKLINFWFSFYFYDVNIKPEQICKIPIKNATSKESIVNLVDQILALKKSNPEADTSSLEAEIDRLVYGLYGLTDEEIRIVEGGSRK